MRSDVDQVLISHDQIAARVRQLAEQITIDHTADGGGNGEITIIPILTGAMIFAADLVRNLPMRMKIGLLTVSSYPGQSIKSQGAEVIAERIGDVTGRHLLLIDDILDSGGTLRLVRSLLLDKRPISLRTCVLLRKATPGARSVPVEYVGFDIPDAFVVGYGLDFDDYYRNLPEIVTLKRHVTAPR